MMSDPIAQPRSAGARSTKFIIQLLLGMVAGAGGMILAITLLRNNVVGRPSIDAVLTIGVGLIYALMALFVAFGTSTPRLGAKLLNVADADELRDDRPYLLASSFACLAIGLALIVMAFSGPGGAISPGMAVIALAFALVTTMIVWVRMRKVTDEFRRLVSARVSEMSWALTILVYGGWAALAQLGYVALFTPLTFLAGAFGIVFVAAYWVAFRHGLLKPL